MTDREKLYDLIVDAENEFYKNNHCAEDSKRIERVVDYLIAHGVKVKQMQKPSKFEKMELCEFCWIEYNYQWNKSIEPALIECRTEEDCRIVLVGCILPIVHKKYYYGKTWRCWAEKPTEEERKAAEWEN